MKKLRTLAVLRDTLRKNLALILLLSGSAGIYAAVFFFYRLPLWEPFFYPTVLVFVFLLFYLALSFLLNLRKARERERLIASVVSDWRSFPAGGSLEERDFREMIVALGTAASRMASEFDAERQDAYLYYTAWVHQIKTPIAVLRLLLAESSSPDANAMMGELLRIEQYVEMVLQYLRLSSEVNDLVIREYPLDGLIRASIRKFAPLFLGRHLKMTYAKTERRIVTDAKWFSCILDQLLSNAVKYTHTGGVTVEVTDEGILSVSDTGIGILPEELPRIFEKGYTGVNGREEVHSSGLGLYLCKCAAEMLSIPVSVESTVGKGSCFSLDLRQPERIE